MVIYFLINFLMTQILVTIFANEKTVVALRNLAIFIHGRIEYQLKCFGDND